MKKAPDPENEIQRLAALHALNILDTPREERFDRVTRIAQALFDVPIVAVSLVDENREWFKSCLGVSGSEGSRSSSFCGHAILQDQILIIPDTLQDARFADNPQVSEQGIRFYAGQPLHAVDGSNIGVFCIKDHRPRELTSEEVGQLKDLASVVENELNEAHLSEVQRALQASEARIRAIFNTAVDGIVTIDENGIIQNVNPAVEKLFGYSAEEMVGKNVKMLMPDPYRREHDGYIANYIETGKAKVIGIGREVLGQRKDGRTFAMELSVSEVDSEKTRLFTGIVRDVTERNRAAEELRVAKQDAEEANRAKSYFLANMSHELRTPMNAIIGYSEMLQEEAEEVGQPGFIPDLEKINKAGRHLLGLINDILDLSKVEAGKEQLAIEDFDVNEMIEEVAATVRPLIKKQSNTLQIECPEAVGTMRNDLTRVRQILFNLLSNATKFTKSGTITLTAKRRKKAEGDLISFAVADTGIGMSPEVLEQVFEPFTQADSSTTRKYGGTGLGLTICRRFCEMLGGQISVQSELGKGSCFTATLLAEFKPPSPEQHPLGSELANMRSSFGDKVLVIDDDPDTGDLVSRFLTREGYTVLSAAGGEEGLRMAREHKPVAVILDVMMPSVDGWSVLSSIKEDAQLKDLPVIMHTGVSDRQLGYALGASDYLIKPINREALLSAVNKYRTESKSRLVLVIEDDQDSMDMLCRIMSKAGWKVTQAENGRAGLDALAREIPDLILLDLMMPEMDGFQFVEEVLKNDEWRAVPKIALTAKEITREVRNRLSGGVLKVLQKGAHRRDELLHEFNRLLQECKGPDKSSSNMEAQ